MIPKCPGCGSPKLDYLSTDLKVICEGCFSRFHVWKLPDFAQFFVASPQNKVCDEIQEIMLVYREQEKTEFGVDTPGGLEHMGDVWSLLRKWDKELEKK